MYLSQRDLESSGSSDNGRSMTDMSDWESVTVDREQWTYLAKQLEDLLVVQCLLKMRPPVHGLAKQACEPEPIVVTLRRILDGGRGRWRCQILFVRETESRAKTVHIFHLDA